VPVHIGVHDLKVIAFLTAQAPFLKWSKNAQISIDDLRLRNKDWVEMVPVPGTPDIDAIASKFFVKRGKSKVVQFYPGKGTEVILELSYEKLTEVIIRLEELETVDVVCPAANLDARSL
jgi:hypothetical protein